MPKLVSTLRNQRDAVRYRDESNSILYRIRFISTSPPRFAAESRCIEVGASLSVISDGGTEFAWAVYISRQMTRCSPNRGECVEQSPDTRQQVRVLLVDHSDLVLQRLKRTLFRSHCAVVVGAASTTEDAVALLKTCRPAVVVLDIQVGRASGIELCRTICRSYPHIAVLFFSANDDKRLLRAAILAGAQGYLLKRASDEAVVKAIEIVAAGQAIVDQQLTQQILKWVRERTGPAQSPRSSRCSASDLRVLSLIAAGKTNKEIARHLNVTPGVFRARLLRIYKRLGISRRSAAASYFTRWEQGALWDAALSARVGPHYPS